MTLSDLFDEVRDRGWLVSNLFQLDDGTWQANLRTITHHTEFGRGPTPELALSLAIEQIETATESVQREAVQVSSFSPSPAVDVFALLARARANLRPATTIRGRFP